MALALNDIPTLLLAMTLLVPILLFSIGVARGRRIDAMEEVGLSAYGLALATFVTAIVSALFSDDPVAGHALIWAVFLVFAALTVGNLLRYPWTSPPGRQERSSVPAAVPRGEESLSRGAPRCAPGLFLDPGLAQSWSERGNTGLLSAVLPGNAYFYFLSIDFFVLSTSLRVEATSRANLRPWYGWFALSLVNFDRDSTCSAAGVVTCETIRNQCVITGVGNQDIDSDVECSSAVVVNAVVQRDPAKVLLEASGGVAFSGQQALKSIKITGQVKGSASSTGQSQIPNPGGGGTTTGSGLNLGADLSVSAEIQLPTIIDNKKKLTRPVFYKCSTSAPAESPG